MDGNGSVAAAAITADVLLLLSVLQFAPASFSAPCGLPGSFSRGVQRARRRDQALGRRQTDETRARGSGGNGGWHCHLDQKAQQRRQGQYIMRRPVTVSSGRTYEAAALREHSAAQRGNDIQPTCPLTTQVLRPAEVRLGHSWGLRTCAWQGTARSCQLYWVGCASADINMLTSLQAGAPVQQPACV